MKKTNRRSKEASPVYASSSAPEDKQNLHYEEKIRQLEQENKAFQVSAILLFLSMFQDELMAVWSIARFSCYWELEEQGALVGRILYNYLVSFF